MEELQNTMEKELEKKRREEEDFKIAMELHKELEKRPSQQMQASEPEGMLEKKQQKMAMKLQEELKKGKNVEQAEWEMEVSQALEQGEDESHGLEDEQCHGSKKKRNNDEESEIQSDAEKKANEEKMAKELQEEEKQPGAKENDDKESRMKKLVAHLISKIKMSQDNGEKSQKNPERQEMEAPNINSQDVFPNLGAKRGVAAMASSVSIHTGAGIEELEKKNREEEWEMEVSQGIQQGEDESHGLEQGEEIREKLEKKRKPEEDGELEDGQGSGSKRKRNSDQDSSESQSEIRSDADPILPDNENAPCPLPPVGYEMRHNILHKQVQDAILKGISEIKLPESPIQQEWQELLRSPDFKELVEKMLSNLKEEGKISTKLERKRKEGRGGGRSRIYQRIDQSVRMPQHFYQHMRSMYDYRRNDNQYAVLNNSLDKNAQDEIIKGLSEIQLPVKLSQSQKEMLSNPEVQSLVRQMLMVLREPDNLASNEGGGGQQMPHSSVVREQLQQTMRNLTKPEPKEDEKDKK